MSHDTIMIDVACNDPDNGLFAGVAEQISVGSDFMELECLVGRPPKFAELQGGIKLGRRAWPTCGSKEWIGNWCWNGYWMKIPDAVDFLAWLQSTHRFHCTCGEERIFNIWNSEKDMDMSDREFLSRMLGKPSTFHRDEVQRSISPVPSKDSHS